MDTFEKVVFAALIMFALASATFFVGLLWIGAGWGAAAWLFNFVFATAGAIVMWIKR